MEQNQNIKIVTVYNTDGSMTRIKYDITKTKPMESFVMADGTLVDCGNIHECAEVGREEIPAAKVVEGLLSENRNLKSENQKLKINLVVENSVVDFQAETIKMQNLVIDSYKSFTDGLKNMQLSKKPFVACIDKENIEIAKNQIVVLDDKAQKAKALAGESRLYKEIAEDKIQLMK